MSLIEYNFSWMAFNLYLAFLPVLFAWLFFYFKNKILKGILFLLWFLYLPNSVYVITDIIHLIRSWDELQGAERVIVLLQHITFELLGLLAFLLALHPFEKALRKSPWKNHKQSLLIGMNFLIGFAIVLGRVDRVNSWDVFLAPQNVVQATINTLTSFNLFALAVLFGLFSNLFYFSFRRLLGGNWRKQQKLVPSPSRAGRRRPPA